MPGTILNTGNAAVLKRDDRSEARWQWVEEVKTPIIGAIFKMLG